MRLWGRTTTAKPGARDQPHPGGNGDLTARGSGTFSRDYEDRVTSATGQQRDHLRLLQRRPARQPHGLWQHDDLQLGHGWRDSSPAARSSSPSWAVYARRNRWEIRWRPFTTTYPSRNWPVTPGFHDGGNPRWTFSGTEARLAKRNWEEDPDFLRIAGINAKRLGMSRRNFLRMVGGVVVVGAGGSLLACGDDDDDSTGEPVGTPAGAQPTLAPPTTTASIVRGGTLTFGLATEPTLGGLDANVTPAAVTHRVIQNIHDTLVTMDSDFKIIPSLASSWDISPDGKTYVFKLRNGVTFHDGTPFNAEAVKFNIDRIRDPATKSYYSIVLLGPIDTVSVIDPQTVQLNFKAPHAPFLDYASQSFLGMVSPAAVQKFGASYADNPVGTGPFMFKEWVKQSRITLVRNPDYTWGSSVYRHSDAAYLDQVVFRFIPESATRTGALQSGEVDVIESVFPVDVEKLRGGNTFVASALSPGSPFVLQMNQSKPPFNDRAVRRAFLHGVDRKGLIKALYNDVYELAEGPLAPTTFAYGKTIEGMYPYDPAKAKQLLEGAGWVPGGGGVRAKGSDKLEAVYLEGDIDREQRHAIAESIQAQLKEIGFDIKIQYLASGPFVEARSQNAYSILGTSFVSSDPDIMTNLYHSSRTTGSAGNASKLQSADVDKLLQEGAQAVTREARISTYARLQHLVMENAVVAPIYSFPYIVAGRKSVNGLTFDSRAYPNLYDVFKT